MKSLKAQMPMKTCDSSDAIADMTNIGMASWSLVKNKIDDQSQ